MKTWTAPDGTEITCAEATFGHSLRAARLSELLRAELESMGDIQYTVTTLAVCLERVAGPRGPLPADLAARVRWVLGLPHTWGPRLIGLLADDHLTPEEERSASATSPPSSSAGSSAAARTPSPASRGSARTSAASSPRRGRGR